MTFAMPPWVEEQTPKVRSNYLTREQLFRLDVACAPIAEVWGNPYLVGSVNERADFRDVDVRLILTDKKYAKQPKEVWAFLGLVVSGYLREQTGLPVDFQVQPRTWANEKYPGKVRNPLGGRTMTSFAGDSPD